MISKERIIKTLKGEPVDRVPIWLRDQFNLGGDFKLRNEKMIDILLLDEFADGWVNKDSNLSAIRDYYKSVGGDIIRECVVPGKVCNRILCTPPSRISLIDTKYEDNKKLCYFEIDTPRGKLTTTTACEKDMSTMWTVKHVIEDDNDFDKLLSIPYELEDIDPSVCMEESMVLGDRGVMMMQIDTPLITVSGLMDFQDFLIMCGTDKERLRELCDIAFERISKVVKSCLDKDMATLYRLNGSEQATPPMNSPKIYEEFVYPYEKKLIELIHSYDKFAAVHSHGKISKNLPLMRQMKLDMLDPIEAPPSGDLTFKEAKAISDGQITLAGNIQFSDMENLEPEEITKQVQELFCDGKKDHIILNVTASPITYVSDKLRDNYIALIEAGIKYGKF